MLSYQPGDRVGALLSDYGQEVQFLGYGVYDGDKPHPQHGFSNPCIKLDNGDIVWGIECWWGNEEKMKKSLEGRNLKHVRLSRGADYSFVVIDVMPDEKPETA